MNLILFEPGESDRFLPCTDPRAAHLRTVLRARPGDAFVAGIVNGRKGYIRILSVAEEGLSFLFTPVEDPPPLLPLELVIGAPRPLVTKRLLKDLTTLGIRTLHFVTAELFEKSYLASSLWKEGEYLRHLREGAEQSGGTLLPEIRLHPDMGTCLASLPPGGRRFALHPSRNYASLRETVIPEDSAILAVGPERGWTERELELFAASGFELLRLGDRILRTEAAALAGSAILLSRMGYM